MRRRALVALATLTLVVAGLVACGPGEVVDPAAEQAAEDLAFLKENKPILDAKRQELRELRELLAGELPEGEASPEGETEGESPTREELEAQATALESEIENLAAKTSERVVSYLNNSGISVGAELTPDQRFAVGVKIDEDILVAQEYIDKGGDYVRALDIYQQVRALDPEHEALLAKIAEAEELRWMTEDRFKQVKKKMTQDEVRELLGQVHRSNVREYPDRGVVAWFYKKEDGGAAAVYFKERNKGKGNWQVYEADFNKVKQQVQEGDG